MDDGLPEWNGIFDEENNSDEECGGIYGHSDNEEAYDHRVSIDMTMKNRDPMKNILKKSLRILWDDRLPRQL